MVTVALFDQNLTQTTPLDLRKKVLANIFDVILDYAFVRYPVVPDTYKGSRRCS